MKTNESPTEKQGVIMSEWISVEDRLPEGECLVYLAETRLGRVHSANYDAGVPTIGFGFAFDAPAVTHWMPLPEPPTDKEQP